MVSDTAERASTRSWLPIYVLVVVLYGCTFMFVRLALDSFTPIGVAIGRVWLAALAFVVMSVITRTRFPPRQMWWAIAVYGLCVALIPSTLLAYAVEFGTTSLVAIVVSTGPLWVLVMILLFFREERPERGRIIGLFVGFAGIMIVLGVWQGVASAALSAIACALFATIAFSFSLPYARRRLTGGSRASDLSPIALSTASMLFVAIAMVPLAVFVDMTRAPLSGRSLTGILCAGLVSSALVSVLILVLVKRTDATTVGTVSYLVPVVTVAIGVLFLGESLTWNEITGVFLILVGAAMAQGLLRALSRR